MPDEMDHTREYRPFDDDDYADARGRQSTGPADDATAVQPGLPDDATMPGDATMRLPGDQDRTAPMPGAADPTGVPPPFMTYWAKSPRSMRRS